MVYLLPKKRDARKHPSNQTHKKRLEQPYELDPLVTDGVVVNPANGSASVAPSKKLAGNCSCADKVKV